MVRYKFKFDHFDRLVCNSEKKRLILYALVKTNVLGHWLPKMDKHGHRGDRITEF